MIHKSFNVLAALIFAVLSMFQIQVLFSQELDEMGENLLARENYFRVIRTGGYGKELPFDAYSKAMLQRLAVPDAMSLPGSPFSTVNWQSVNPQGLFYSMTGSNYISGRVTSIAFHPADANTFYITPAQGGVWKTTNGGANWSVIDNGLTSLASGYVVVDQSNANVLYYGTGEFSSCGGCQYGAGIFKSTNAGASWQNVAPSSQVGNYIQVLAIDPTNSNVIYSGGSGGIFKSVNAGANWVNIFSESNIGIYSIIVDPVTPQTVFISCGDAFTASSNTIRRSTNGGTSFQVISSDANYGRIMLAMAPNNHLVVYASIAMNSGNNGLYRLNRTTNGGDNWFIMSTAPNYMGSQGWVHNAVTVNPTNSNSIIVGGLDVYSSTDGGTTLVQRSNWSTNNTSQFSHADIKYLAYKNSVLYCGSDGGIFKSTDNGSSWSDLNRTISSLQIVSADYDPTALAKMYNGAQDNNKATSINGGNDWNQRTTGDGGYTVVDPVNPNFIYGAYVNGSVQRSDDFGVTFDEIAPSGSSGGLFYNPYELAPGDHNTIVFGRADLWKTTSAQTATSSSGWVQIASTGTIGGNVSAIGISPVNTNKIYIGTDNGKILYTTNNGAAWNTAAGSFNYVTDFAIDPQNDNICYASFGGATDSRVSVSTDGGATWTDITANHPMLAVNSLIMKSNGTRVLVAGGDAGVYYTLVSGAPNWVRISDGLPAVQIKDLKFHESAGLLMAASYGRGVYTIDLGSVIGVKGYSNEIPKTFSLSQNYPNPFNPNTHFKFGVPANNNTGIVNLSVYDLQGRLVETLINSELHAGTYNVEWDASKYSSGVYFYSLAAGDFKEVKKMILLK